MSDGNSRSASSFRKGTYTDSHVKFLTRLNVEKFPFISEKEFIREGEFNDDGKQKVWVVDALIFSILTADIDGDAHLSRHAEKNDGKKDAWLIQHGFVPFRFTNDMVNFHLDDCIKVIRQEAWKRNLIR